MKADYTDEIHRHESTRMSGALIDTNIIVWQNRAEEGRRGQKKAIFRAIEGTMGQYR